MNRFGMFCIGGAALGLSACADPLSSFDRLSDVPLAEGAEAASVVPGAADSAGAPPVLPGLLAGIFGGRDAPDVASAAQAQSVPDSAVSAVVSDIIDGPQAGDIADTPGGAPIVTALAAPEPVERRGFLGGLFGGLGATPASVATPGIPAGAVQIPGGAPLPPGSAVPYGVIATVCGIDASAMGRTVESASGYTVYDTNPSSTAPRTQFITGFSDGCARQFFGTLAIFGDIGTHELVRYSTAAGTGYTATDNTYEEIKSAYCGVAARVPCGARLDRLAERTTFLTIYESFGTRNGWADILLHDGRVVAQDF